MPSKQQVSSYYGHPPLQSTLWSCYNTLKRNEKINKNKWETPTTVMACCCLLIFAFYLLLSTHACNDTSKNRIILRLYIGKSRGCRQRSAYNRLLHSSFGIIRSCANTWPFNLSSFVGTVWHYVWIWYKFRLDLVNHCNCRGKKFNFGLHYFSFINFLIYLPKFVKFRNHFLATQFATSVLPLYYTHLCVSSPSFICIWLCVYMYVVVCVLSSIAYGTPIAALHP